MGIKGVSWTHQCKVWFIRLPFSSILPLRSCFFGEIEYPHPTEVHPVSYTRWEEGDGVEGSGGDANHPTGRSLRVLVSF
jgi:hypothetical protein